MRPYNVYSCTDYLVFIPARAFHAYFETSLLDNSHWRLPLQLDEDGALRLAEGSGWVTVHHDPTINGHDQKVAPHGYASIHEQKVSIKALLTCYSGAIQAVVRHLAFRCVFALS